MKSSLGKFLGSTIVSTFFSACSFFLRILLSDKPEVLPVLFLIEGLFSEVVGAIVAVCSVLAI
ncbi:hypothetical protein [Aquimarina sp. LLG6339-5]|uniref:hypothetical protein n=1 Tax=Aquimarina sp. LLG6339-5 TaxID=3160830 RepID=UPI00386EB895